MIRKAIRALHDCIDRGTGQLKELESQIKSLALLNHRRRGLVDSTLRHPNRDCTVRGHQTVHNVVYQTSRTDLLELVELGLFEKRRCGRSWIFEPVVDLEKALGDL